ncbi:MAG: type II toxin-antitoxin system Phd/YefM family antitoxin [bacterium]
MQINVHEAKTQFYRLLNKVEMGEEITIARAGRPVARLVPVSPDVSKRVPGAARGEILIADNFDAPLPYDVLQAFES